MLKAKMEEVLNKQSVEITQYQADLARIRRENELLINQLNWHRQANQDLIRCLDAGAREGNWPRRTNTCD